MMAKQFDPIEYNYEISSDQDGAINFQRIIDKPNPCIQDIIELAYLKDEKIWIIFIELENLLQFIKEDIPAYDSSNIILYAGEIKSDFEYQLITKRMAKEPETLIKLLTCR